MQTNRRGLIRIGLAFAAVGGVGAASAQAERLAGGREDVAAELQREIDAAAKRGRAFLLPAGTLYVSQLRLHDGVRLIGVRGESRIVLAGEGPLVVAEGVGRITLTGIVFDGAGRALPPERGLVTCAGVQDILISDCIFEKAGGVALRLERCGGWIERNDVRDIAAGGIASNDATGLVIADNVVQRCGDDAITVSRGRAGNDGTHVTGNRVLDIRAGSVTGSGNGVSLLRTGGVTVSGNTIRRCAAGAVRNTGGRNVIIAGNECASLGGTAILAEAGFAGCVVSNNVIDGALSGIQLVAGSDESGPDASCNGNIIRRLRPSDNHAGHDRGHEVGIKVEVAATVSGNLIEGAPWVGILAGWGPALRDVAISGNVVRGAPIGIGVSVAQGAGGAIVTGNVIAGATTGAIVGMTLEKVSVDFAKGGTVPAALLINGNRAM